MEITEARVSPVEKSNGRLKGFATITFDNVLVVRGIRIVEGEKGLFIAMPNRKAEFRCGSCNAWNVFHARYCNRCGKELARPAGAENSRGDDEKNYHDIVHPIDNAFRQYVQGKILEAYQVQLESGGPGPKSEAPLS